MPNQPVQPPEGDGRPNPTSPPPPPFTRLRCDDCGAVYPITRQHKCPNRNAFDVPWKAIPITEGKMSKGGQNPPPTSDARPPAPGGSGGNITSANAKIAQQAIRIAELEAQLEAKDVRIFFLDNIREEVQQKLAEVEAERDESAELLHELCQLKQHKEVQPKAWENAFRFAGRIRQKLAEKGK